MNKNISTSPSYTLPQLVKFIDQTENKFNSRSVQVVFYGGEPTLNLQFIEESIIFLSNNLSQSCQFILHTNGLLLRNSSINLLSRFDLIIVSINYEKIPRVGLVSSYFSEVIEGIREIRKRYPILFLARLTVTEKCSLYTYVMQVSSFFDYVYWQLQNCVEFVSFSKFKQNYDYELNILLENWYQYFLQGQLIHYVPFVSMVSEIFHAAENTIPCGYQTNMINIQTNGECYSCPEATMDENFLIGNIYDGIELNKRKSMMINCCKNCNFYTMCKGRCGRMHTVLPNYRIEEYCSLNESMFSFFLKNQKQILNTLHNRPELVSELMDPNYMFTERIP